MNEYWKDPRLDDEGTYDYLVEELPSDTAKWQWYYQKCDSCGKYHRLNFESTHYFYCWDGWDSMTYAECWKCRLKDKIYAIKAKIKRKIKARKEYRSWIKQFKEKGVEITEELKQTIHNIVNKEVMG
jgi:phage terminase large subunit GpA-like protein